MISRVETAQNWLENITHQMNNMKYREQANYLAGHALFSVIYGLSVMIMSVSPIGLLKKYSTETAQATAQDAVQNFGGRGITKTNVYAIFNVYTRLGMGRVIEHVCSVMLSTPIYLLTLYDCSIIVLWHLMRESDFTILSAQPRTYICFLTASLGMVSCKDI